MREREHVRESTLTLCERAKERESCTRYRASERKKLKKLWDHSPKSSGDGATSTHTKQPIPGINTKNKHTYTVEVKNWNTHTHTYAKTDRGKSNVLQCNFPAKWQRVLLLLLLLLLLLFDQPKLNCSGQKTKRAAWKTSKVKIWATTTAREREGRGWGRNNIRKHSTGCSSSFPIGSAIRFLRVGLSSAVIMSACVRVSMCVY